MTLSTGIPELDKQFTDSPETPCSLLFFSDALSEKRLLAEKFVLTGLESGETCVYVDFYRSPALARANFARMGRFRDDQLVLVDAVSRKLMIPSGEEYVLENRRDVDEIQDVVERAIRERGARRVVLDSLEFLLDRLEKRAVVTFARWLAELCEDMGATLVFLFTNWTFDDDELRDFKKLAECFVEFRSSLMGGVSVNEMKVLRSAGRNVPGSDWIPFSFTDAMGFESRAPRILVVGDAKSGKSTFLRSLDAGSITIQSSVEGADDDDGLRPQVTAISVEVFGAPEDAAFEASFDVFTREVDGVILLVDSSSPGSVEKSKPILQMLTDGLPFVVVANKQDVPGAMTVEEIARELGLGVDARVLGAVSTIDKGVWEAVDTLLSLIVGGSRHNWSRNGGQAK